MLITKEVAQELETCIKNTHIEVTKNYPQGQFQEIGSGVACFSGFDSFLSQSIGWGFNCNLKQMAAQLSQIEAFYRKLSHPRVDLEISPYVGTELIEFLSARGYKVSEINNVSVLDLRTYKQQDYALEQGEIKIISVEAVDEWAKRIAMGFEYPDAQEHFSCYARALGVSTFGAYIDSNLVAGATISVNQDICDLGVTSTLHAFRGQGLQKKLLLARLNYAKKLGLAVATVTTEPGTISDLNVQKIGFHCAYTRIKMTFE